MPKPRNPRRKPAVVVDERRLYWEVGYRIRIARDAMGLTQTELAEKAGLSRVSIANLEGGRQRSPLTVLYRVAHALGVKPARFLPSPADVVEATHAR